MKTSYSDADKTLVDGAIQSLGAMRRSNGRLPYGAAAKVAKAFVEKGIPLTLNCIYKRLERMGTESRSKINTTNINNSDNDDDRPIIAVGPVKRKCRHTTICRTPNPKKQKRNPGRPRGSTIVNQLKRSHTIARAKNEIAREVCEIRRTQFGCLDHGQLEQIIEKKKAELGIPDVHIPKKTIMSRFKPGRELVTFRPGPKSPIKVIEEIAVQIAIELARIGHPLTSDQGLRLVNSLLDTSENKEKLRKWKEKNGLSWQKDEQIGKLSKKYWRLLLKRHRHIIQMKTGTKFPIDRSRWSKKVYIEEMFSKIYDNLVECKLAKRLQVPVSKDRDGNVVESDKQFGEKCDIEITHPQWILFGDETGCNTCMRDDGNYSGTKYVVPVGSTPRKKVVCTDHRFTLFPLVAATGELVVNVVIFNSAATAVRASWHSGYDIRSKIITNEKGEPVICEENCGEGKFYSEGLTTEFRGKRIPMLTFASQGGGMTADILVSIFKYLDAIGVYQRTPNGPRPVLILDGHETRLSYPFLEYVNQPSHYWSVNLGAPYLTHLWQPADSTEMNGRFKQAWYDEKEKLVDFKIMRRYKRITLDMEDIIPLVNRALRRSICNVASNKKVLAERGWYPPNRKLLSHKDVLDWANNTNDPSEKLESAVLASLASVNVSHGFSSQVIQYLLRHAMEQGAMEHLRRKQLEGKTLEEIVKNAKRLTAGLLVRHHQHNINGSLLLNHHRRRLVEQKKEQNRKERNEAIRMRTRIIEANAAREKHSDLRQWKKTELEALFQAKKVKKDGKMPNKKDLLLQKCISIDDRPMPPLPPLPDLEQELDDGSDVLECGGCGFCVECKTFDSGDNFCASVEENEDERTDDNEFDDDNDVYYYV